MTREQEALARRAVACAAWRWMPGMLTLPFHENGPDSPVCHPPWRVTREGVRGPYAHPENNDAPPDLTDPATLGCLLALVREAARAESEAAIAAAIAAKRDPSRRLEPMPERAWPVSDALRRALSLLALSEPESTRQAISALVAALEAAAPRSTP